MKKSINACWLVNKSMSKMHLRQPAFIYNTYWPFKKKETQNKEDLKNLKKQEIRDIFIKNKLDKASFRHDMVC